MNRVNVFEIHRCIDYEGYGLIQIFTEKIPISPTKLWRVCMGRPAGLNDGISQKRLTSADNRDFNVCIIRCVCRAELILGLIVYLS